ncbi:MAG: nucleolar RNA-binding Nop10p family protein [Methanolobus sp.]
MGNKFFKCRKCGRYSLENTCKQCGSDTFRPQPARFSQRTLMGNIAD